MRDFNTLCGSVIYPILVKRRGTFVASTEHVQEVKPFFKVPSQILIQTVRPWDRLSVDFKGHDIGLNIGVAKGSPRGPWGSPRGPLL